LITLNQRFLKGKKGILKIIKTKPLPALAGSGLVNIELENLGIIF